VVNRELRSGDETVSRTIYSYRSDSDLLLASVEKRLAEGKVIDRGMMRRDSLFPRPQQRTVRGGSGDVHQGRSGTRDRKKPDERGGLETWKYTLGKEGNIAREEYYRRGSLEKVTLYGEGKLRTEELYKEGELFLKAYFDGDTRLREEVYSGGKVTEERKYP